MHVTTDIKVVRGRERTQLPLLPNILLVLHHISVLTWNIRDTCLLDREEQEAGE